VAFHINKSDAELFDVTQRMRERLKILKSGEVGIVSDSKYLVRDMLSSAITGAVLTEIRSLAEFINRVFDNPIVVDSFGFRELRDFPDFMHSHIQHSSNEHGWYDSCVKKMQSGAPD
jgi:hypothetical protein